MAEYTLTNSAAVVDASIQKVANATTTPTDSSPLMVTSGGVKAYVDTQDTALEAQILANTAAIAVQSSSVKQAVFSFPDTTFHSSQSLTGWTLLSDNTGGVTYTSNGTSNGTFTLGSGVWVGFFSSLATEFDDRDDDRFTFSLRKNGSNIWSRSLNGALPFNPLIVQRSLAGSNPYDFYMYENPTNTSTRLENTVFVLTKYA